MFFDDPSKAYTTIIAKRGPKGERTMEPTPMKPEIVKDESGELDGKHLAAQDILAAHHTGSAEDLNQALSNFIDLHHAGVTKLKG
jgi:hypothetical protein